MNESASAVARRILCVFPRYTTSFGTFEYSYGLTLETKAFMPPQGLLVIAAILPRGWQVRFIDENIDRATEADFRWADVVFLSGMHIQRRQIEDLARRAHREDKAVVLGGPSVSACPAYYPSIDYLHIGELGDATDILIGILARDAGRPDKQIILTTQQRRALTDFPMPAYELAKIRNYLLGTIQYSSGCPYTCEFCDIPDLYGRKPRLKRPQQIIAELDKLVQCGVAGSVYFVDDNFIGNRRAAKDLLPHLIEWHKRNGYSVVLSCEATLNIARSPEILELMRQAAFASIFCGIETPEPEALKSIDKEHNLMVPILDSVRAINAHGMQVVAGIILGLDTDRPDTGRRILDFIAQSQIPMLTINLLQALPRTPLWDRLQREGRLETDENLESNVRFELPYDDVVAMWRECMQGAYAPATLFARYTHLIRATWPNRWPRPFSRQRYSPKNVKRGLVMLGKVFWKLGIRGDYKRVFWTFALPRLVRFEFEAILTAAIAGHHLVMFARDAVEGRSNASNYSPKLRVTDEPVTQ